MDLKKIISKKILFRTFLIQKKSFQCLKFQTQIILAIALHNQTNRLKFPLDTQNFRTVSSWTVNFIRSNHLSQMTELDGQKLVPFGF